MGEGISNFELRINEGPPVPLYLPEMGPCEEAYWWMLPDFAPDDWWRAGMAGLAYPDEWKVALHAYHP